MLGSEQSKNGNIVRFGVFEVDLHSQELRKSGLRLRLAGQSFQALSMLLDRPGELVTREELRLALWPADTFVDFEHGLNAAITRVREVLGDSAENPRFIETLPRRGYRFVGAIHPPIDAPAPPPAQPHRIETPTKRFLRVTRSFRTAFAAFFGVAVAVGALEIYRARFRPEPAISVVPFTTLSGMEVAPSFSPDGRRIAFAWNGGTDSSTNSFNASDTEGFDVYVKEVGSEHLLRLTHTPGDSISTEWSPDGRFIAFTRVRKDSAGVYLISALGGVERQLRAVHMPREFRNSLSWSSDGHYLTYPDGKEWPNIVKLSVLDMNRMENVDPQLPECMSTTVFRFAPNSHKLGVACQPSWGITQIYVIPEIGATPRRITRLFGFPTGFTWTADGREFIVSVLLGEQPVWRIEEATGKSRPLLLGAESTNLITLHGDRLAFDNRTDISNIWQLDLESDHPQPRQLIASTRFQGRPRFSPDGKRVTFESSRSGFSEIWMCNRDGSDAVQLTNFHGPLTGSPDWSPDGRTLVFDSRADWHANLYLIDINERIPRLLHTDVTENSTPGWSRNGKWIYFRSEGQGKIGIFKVAREGGSAVEVSPSDGYYPTESDDRQRLFYWRPDFQARQVLLATGQSQEIPGLPGSGLVSWGPGREGIFALELTRQGLVINLYDRATGKPKRIADLPSGTHPTIEERLAVSPDGHHLLFAQVDQANSDIMMVENFH